MRSLSNFIIVEVESNITRTKTVGPDKLGIARRTLVFGVASQHALNAQTNTFHILYWRPSLRSKQIQTDDSICVDVRMDGNRAIWMADKDDFWWF